jgi:diaminohydroxyphosphoribosylaminopyrimidine deaminase/5-amino-6-(5-phosphoribosylamino)uracil reductase
MSLYEKDQQNYQKYMERAIWLAEKARGFTSPNPLVGAVLVKNDRIIGEDYHKIAGEAHAEINALDQATENPKGATLFVTLEPCNHFGRTPPCTEAIIKAGIREVVIGSLDPNPLNSGAGIERLAEAGIKLKVGILAERVQEQNEIYFTYITQKRPFILVKVALSLDGKISQGRGVHTVISGKEANSLVHRIRSEYDSIMVGIGTIKTDNPRLTVRNAPLKRKLPLRIIVDSKASLPLESYVVKSAKKIDTLLAVTERADVKKIRELAKLGVEVIKLPSVEKELVSLKALFKKLYEREITSVLVEGGSQLIATLVKENLVDKYLFIIGPYLFGLQGVDLIGDNLLKSAELTIKKVEKIGPDVTIEAYPKDLLINKQLVEQRLYHQEKVGVYYS